MNERRLAAGAEITAEGKTHFRLWAPEHRRVELALEAGSGTPNYIAMQPEENGYFSCLVGGAPDGTRYRYRLEGDKLYPDPASRYQPQGPHGLSQVIDPSVFPWSDGGWKGLRTRGLVISEIHIGTFTQEGTWESAAKELAGLAETGITAVEIMPVADFPGAFGWGYDGVNLYAPSRLYGTPDDMRRFVDRAHQLHLGVILDIVYNHLGPEGNYLPAFSKYYFNDGKDTEWGTSINYDGSQSGPVREFIAGNAGYWIDEYHIDGLRLDATQSMYDNSKPHIVAENRRPGSVAGAGTRYRDHR